MRYDKKFKMLIRVYDIYLYFFERIVNIALSQFDWENLPDTCDRLYIERTALYNGAVAFSIPSGLDVWLSTGFLPVTKNIPTKYVDEYLNIEKKYTEQGIKDYNNIISGELNIEDQILKQNSTGFNTYLNTNSSFDVYGYPRNIRGIGYNGEQWECEEWMIFYDNMTKTSLLPKIDLYAKMMTEVYCTMRNNIRQMNTPYIVTSPKNRSKSIKELFRAIFSFEPVIEINQSIDDDIKVLSLKTEYIADDLMELSRDLWRECLNMLGISANNPKKERLVTEEVAMDKESDIISLNSRLLNRKDFCDKINKKYGLNISVKLSSLNYNVDDLVNESLNIGGD